MTLGSASRQIIWNVMGRFYVLFSYYMNIKMDELSERTNERTGCLRRVCFSFAHCDCYVVKMLIKLFCLMMFQVLNHI